MNKKIEAFRIPFNRPFMAGNELYYIEDAIRTGKVSGNGSYTKKCHAFFEDRFKFLKVFLTTSCTDALEMTALLSEVGPGDEVIIPSYTFVSTANAFVLRGATLRFADSQSDHPNVDPEQIQSLITPATKAIVVVHYGGVACDMERICNLARVNNILLIEDAAQSIDAYYNERPLGSFGDMATFSFHETKNIMAGEGGLLVVNREDFVERAEVLWEKGTNRAAFFRGDAERYEWIDLGSSFLPSDITAAFLFGQLEQIDRIQRQRIKVFETYYDGLREYADRGYFQLPILPKGASQNGHVFYLICRSLGERTRLIAFLREREILAVFHYLPLHLSSFFLCSNPRQILPNAERFGETLVRLPLYYDLDDTSVREIISAVKKFYDSETEL